jgi:hypothetical protein
MRCRLFGWNPRYGHPFPLYSVIYLQAIARSIPMAVGSCVVLGAAMGTFDYSGQLTGEKGETREEKRRQFFKQPLKPLVATNVE